MKSAFNRLTKQFWRSGTDPANLHVPHLMIQKCLSIFFHLANVHHWTEGRFVDLFHNLVGPYNFKEENINDIWMVYVLECNHDENEQHEPMNTNNADYILLLDEVCSNLRIEQLQRTGRIISMSALESFHSIVISYRPKRYHLYVFTIFFFSF